MGGQPSPGAAQGTNTSREPDLIIDGHQRVTTVALLLTALVEHLSALPPEQQEPVAGFAPEKIRGQFLTNPYNSGDAHFKLTAPIHRSPSSTTCTRSASRGEP